jgi:hypothetical protein
MFSASLAVAHDFLLFRIDNQDGFRVLACGAEDEFVDEYVEEFTQPVSLMCAVDKVSVVCE